VGDIYRWNEKKDEKKMVFLTYKSIKESVLGVCVGSIWFDCIGINVMGGSYAKCVYDDGFL